jgi:O-antigen ligase
MLNIILAFYALFFTILAWKNFRWSVGWLILTLPAYLLRFQIGPIPITLLEINFLIIFLVWVVKNKKSDWQILGNFIKNNKIFFIFLSLLILSATISVFIGNDTYKDSFAALKRGAGIWKAFFIEPILLFFILLTRIKEKSVDSPSLTSNFLFNSLALSTISISLVAIGQQFFSCLFPPQLWNDNFFGRSTSFFSSPNAIGLFLAPIIILIIAKLWQKNQNKKENVFYIITLLLGIVAIAVSFSDGAFVALATGLIIFIWLIGFKKSAVLAVLIGIILIAFTPRLQSAVLFQDKAGQNRLALWSYTEKFLTASPNNFIFGAGLRKFFHSVQTPFYNPQTLERLNYPHNIFLNFWTEIGLFGMIGFMGIFILSIWQAWKIKKINLILGTGFISALSVIFIHGLVDVPYFKNDLTILFWLILILIFTFKSKNDSVHPLA